ncbi:unnamed protein product [Paramecium octaurelia]|uniref:ATP-grasp fold succinyl-CoA synthetase-type domain-containing protein n=1 Tax=Paramecium octaurelia TaxID=43137 RepID=A0A8S1Y3X0_PAROT|nr:unnamed protein product [Paramecium octaurelia]
MFNRITRLPGLQHEVVECFYFHECQSKGMIRRYNVLVQNGEFALNADEASKFAIIFDPSGGLILKSQVHAGGRGKELCQMD